jgi:hypothetical protein
MLPHRAHLPRWRSPPHVEEGADVWSAIVGHRVRKLRRQRAV